MKRKERFVYHALSLLWRRKDEWSLMSSRADCSLIYPRAEIKCALDGRNYFLSINKGREGGRGSNVSRRGKWRRTCLKIYGLSGWRETHVLWMIATSMHRHPDIIADQRRKLEEFGGGWFRNVPSQRGDCSIGQG